MTLFGCKNERRLAFLRAHQQHAVSTECPLKLSDTCALTPLTCLSLQVEISICLDQRPHNGRVAIHGCAHQCRATTLSVHTLSNFIIACARCPNIYHIKNCAYEILHVEICLCLNQRSHDDRESFHNCKHKRRVASLSVHRKL